MADGVEFKLDGGPEWDRVIAALEEVQTTLPGRIRASLTEVVDPWMAHAESTVASMPIKGVGRQTGLRGEVAGSVKKDVAGTADTVEVTVTSSLPHGVGEENEAAIPPGLDSPTGWRHPVFGNDNNWVQQIPLRHGWFSDAFDNHHDEVENKIQKQLDNARDTIASAGA